MPPGAPIAIESNVGAIWGAKQAARGTPAVTATKRLRWVDGDMAVARAMATENYADGHRFANGMDYLDTLNGGGSPVVEGQPSEAAWLLAQHWGGDVVVAGGGTAPSTHTIALGDNPLRWLTFWKKLGLSVGPIRELYTDCLITQTVVQCMASQKVLRVTPTVVSLNPGVKYAAPDPTADDSGEDPFLWTQAQGTFDVDGLGAGAIIEIQEVTLTVSDAATPVYGDRAAPVVVVPGRGTAQVALTLTLTDNTLPLWNRMLYGTDTPAPGAQPIAGVHYGSIDFAMAYGAGDALRSWRLQVPKFQFATTATVNVQPNGGEISLPVGGEARLNGTDPMATVTVTNGDGTAY